MDLLSIIGLLILIYYFVYIVSSFLLDCDILLAFKEKFGKPVSSLKSKTVWITGASSGIGEALAYELARAGCKLVLSARRVPDLERVKEKCLEVNKDLFDNDVLVYPLDMLDFDSHRKAFERVIEKWGKLDIMVHNAGRSQRAHWKSIEIAVDREMFDLNVFSILSLSRMAVDHFLQTGSGHIVINSSLAGICPLPLSASYSGSKHALHGYFESLRLEYIDHIDVTMVCPGPIQTNFLAESFTAKAGEKYGVRTEISQSKMSAQRCATLMGVAIANKLQEVWLAKSPTLRILYLSYCFPNVMKWIIQKVGKKYIIKLRDAKVSDEK